jgi:hypothetical protein
MKFNLILRITLPILLGLLTACSPELPPSETSDPAEDIMMPASLDGTPSPTPVTESTTEAAAFDAGLCAHPYFPIALGASWTYQGSSGPEGVYIFTDAVSDIQDEVFTMTATFSRLTRTQEWTCTTEGLTAMQYTGAGAAGSVVTEGSTAEFETISFSGVSLLRDIAIGDTWTLTFEVTGEQTLPGGELAETKGTVTYEFEAKANESVSVPAGDFEALRIDVTTNLSFTISMGGVGAPMEMTTSGSSWYARGVGQVKSISSGTFFDQPVEETLELLSYSVP